MTSPGHRTRSPSLARGLRRPGLRRGDGHGPGRVGLGGRSDDMVLEWNANAISASRTPTARRPRASARSPPLVGDPCRDGPRRDLRRGQRDRRDARAVSARRPGPGRRVAGRRRRDRRPSRPRRARARDPAPVTASLDALYAASLGRIDDGQAKTDGSTVGAAAAAAMLADRTGDGRTGTERSRSGPSPASGASCHPATATPSRGSARSRPFSLRSRRPAPDRGPAGSRRARSTPPSSTRSRRSGAQTGRRRTPAQDALASFIVGEPDGVT